MAKNKYRVLVTGANGFIGKNLILRLEESDKYEVVKFSRSNNPSELPELVAKVDAVVHLAGENRPIDEQCFFKVNVGLTKAICDAVRADITATGRNIVVLFASSIQAALENPYGLSKREAEITLQSLAKDVSNSNIIFRLPGVFGKWCKPNYNSVVATFCYNAARGLPLQIHEPEKLLKLVYVDDVVSAIICNLESKLPRGLLEVEVEPVYQISLGELASKVLSFKECRTSLKVDKVGVGLSRALYSTYLSYLPSNEFSYKLQEHKDHRGVFVEFLKTQDSGQFSFFTAKPGVTRGSHYHHTKTEKFLVVKGKAKFRFRHIVTNEIVEINSSEGNCEVIDTIPGWSHDITNIGATELIVFLWANENFDRDKPDTIACEV